MGSSREDEAKDSFGSLGRTAGLLLLPFVVGCDSICVLEFRGIQVCTPAQTESREHACALTIIRDGS